MAGAKRPSRTRLSVPLDPVGWQTSGNSAVTRQLGASSLDLKHFFDGQQSRENSASAFLATLLDFDPGFRQAFLALLPVDPPLDASQFQAVTVEDTLGSTGGGIDITMDLGSTLVVIENKVASSAKQDGQLVGYYRRAISQRGGQRIVAVYLAPTTGLGNSEIASVQGCDEFTERHPRSGGDDAAMCLTWAELAETIDATSRDDDWFAMTGIRAVEGAIEKAARARPFDEQREEVQRIVDAARKSLATTFPDLHFRRWPSFGEEAIYTAKAPVTLWVTTMFEEEPAPSYRLRDVVIEGRVQVTIMTSFNLSSKGQKSPLLTDQWDALRQTGGADVPGLGRLTIGDGKKFVHRESFDGSAGELEAVLIERGQRGLEFLRGYFTSPQAAE